MPDMTKELDLRRTEMLVPITVDLLRLPSDLGRMTSRMEGHSDSSHPVPSKDPALS